MSSLKLTPTSYIVLGLIELSGDHATPYSMKQVAAMTVGGFWTLQHAQFYTEPERLAAAGLLNEEREDGGRRRKLYSLTAAGREALERWRAEPTSDLTELRDPGLLKLFFGADVPSLAAAQADAHRRKLEEYEQLRSSDTGDGPRGPWLALEAGIGHTREWVRWWSKLAEEGR